jgi:SAM-dependent methyltransferase
LLPVNYWRNLAFRFTLDELRPTPGERILDIGSPKLLSLFLAERTGAEVYSTDRDPYFLPDYRNNRELSPLAPGKFHLLQQDARKLAFSDEYFHSGYSLSVIEHIPGSGDGECLREVNRVLQPGGRFVATVPFHPEGRIEYRRADFYWSRPDGSSPTKESVFYQRRYSEDELYRRLIEPSGLKLEKLVFIGTALPEGDRDGLPGVLAGLPGPIQLILPRLMIRGPEDDWRKLKYPSAAYMVYIKQ